MWWFRNPACLQHLLDGHNTSVFLLKIKRLINWYSISSVVLEGLLPESLRLFSKHDVRFETRLSGLSISIQSNWCFMPPGTILHRWLMYIIRTIGTPNPGYFAWTYRTYYERIWTSRWFIRLVTRQWLIPYWEPFASTCSRFVMPSFNIDFSARCAFQVFMAELRSLLQEGSLFKSVAAEVFEVSWTKIISCDSGTHHLCDCTMT